MTSRPPAKHPLLAVLAVAALLGTSACGSTTSTTASTSAASDMPGSAMPDSSTSTSMAMGTASPSTELTIHIQNFRYTALEVAAGATVTAMNMDTAAHTVTADGGSFDVVIPGKQSVTFTAPAKAGSYAYHCKYHANMQGTLTVK